MDRRIIRDTILNHNLIDEERLRELEALSASSGDSLLETILNGGYLKEDVLLPLIGDFFGIKWVDIERLSSLEPSLYLDLPEKLKEYIGFVPLFAENGKVIVAVSDPMEVEALDILRDTNKWQIKLVLASQKKIILLRERFEKSRKEKPLDEALTEIKADSYDEKSLEDLANEAPIIKLVNLIIMQAISEGASDIHIEPYENEAIVRYRVDGVLRVISKYPKEQYPAIISRIKIMADLNIAERRIPQDGRIAIKVMDREYDLRVATIPVLYGEGVVMRILDKESILVSLTDLGFLPETLESFNTQIRKPHGIVLVTGPTGSGKTTTLYAALSAIKSEQSKIITIEDPVEYQLDGISQIHVNAQVGLTFAAGLRSILRLDPDIVMVGEIRDLETAEIAIRAALTGHLVFSTLHTNDATSAIVRLMDMGIPPYLLSSSINVVLAQRLVRRICEFCKEEIPPTESARALLEEAGISEIDKVFVGTGCEECSGTGYSGRTGIHELYEISPEDRQLINQKVSAEVLRSEAQKRGMRLLREDGIMKMAQGVTTAEEIIRVTQMD